MFLVSVWFQGVVIRDGRAFLVSRSRAPAFSRSRHFRNAGVRERNFIQERGNAERERIGMLNSRSSEEMIQLLRVLRGEVERGIVDDPRV